MPCRSKNRSSAGSITPKTACLALACVAVIAFAVFKLARFSGADEVAYPYWCRDCKAVYDVSELKKDYPKNWRIPDRAPSDSVVFCVRCEKGWAYPVATCYQCDTRYVVHLWIENDCPKCHPRIAKAAAARGINVTPPEIKR